MLTKKIRLFFFKAQKRERGGAVGGGGRFFCGRGGLTGGERLSCVILHRLPGDLAEREREVLLTITK